MKTRIAIISFLALFFSCSGYAQPDTLLNRYRSYIYRTSTVQTDAVKNWAGNLNASKQWPDIDYQDKELAGWKIAKHLVRIREMALAWSYPSSSLYHDAQTWKTLNAALDHWLEKRYQSANWWHNEIGIPRLMRDIIILLRNDLEPARLQQALQVMAQLRVRDNATGGNLVWCADLGLHYGALTNDLPLIERCRDLIMAEIRISDGDGIKPDHSFHQHGKRLQMFQYGKAYLWESVRVAWQCRNTSWAFPEEKTGLLNDVILQGWQWMARGINTVPGTIDRSSSRKGELRSADLRPLIPFLVELSPAVAGRFRELGSRQEGHGSLIGYRYYPYSDFSAYQRPGWSFFLKTISTRTLATESINSENLRGKLLNSGDAYLVRNGQEYFNMMPVWDWMHLPGVTAFKTADHIDRQEFTGSVSDGMEGLSVMDYVLKNKPGDQTLTTHKFWACQGDLVVCLLSYIDVQNIGDSLYTTLDQCRRQGDVTVNKTGNILRQGAHRIEKVKWVHHAGLAYIPLIPATIDLHLETVTGSWTTINTSETKEPVTENIFLPVMDHERSKHGATGYVLALCSTPEQAEKIAAKPVWKILRNDRECQAVQFSDGTVMAAFYAPGNLKAPSIKNLQVDQPCLVMVKNGKSYISDPAHKGPSVKITLNNRSSMISLPVDGTTIIQE